VERLVVERATDGERLWTVAVAGSWQARLRGLIGRTALDAREGLYLPGTNSIHMLFMRFAIDCVFVGAPRPDGACEVVAVRHDLRPWTGVVWWVRGARGALEVAAGAAAGAGVRAGDLIRLAPAA
jgi:hypothetical protein